MNTTTMPTTKSAAEKSAMFRRLDGLRSDLLRAGLKKHDQVIALIVACLNEGVTTGPEIVGTIAHLGYNKRHVGKQLKDNIGHLWHRDGDRFYTALQPLS